MCIGHSLSLDVASIGGYESPWIAGAQATARSSTEQRLTRRTRCVFHVFHVFFFHVFKTSAVWTGGFLIFCHRFCLAPRESINVHVMPWSKGQAHLCKLAALWLVLGVPSCRDLANPWQPMVSPWQTHGQLWLWACLSRYLCGISTASCHVQDSVFVAVLTVYCCLGFWTWSSWPPEDLHDRIILHIVGHLPNKRSIQVQVQSAVMKTNKLLNLLMFISLESW